MKKILNTNPERRYTIDKIRNHPWYKKSGVRCEIEGLIVGYHDIPVTWSLLSIF